MSDDFNFDPPDWRAIADQWRESCEIVCRELEEWRESHECLTRELEGIGYEAGLVRLAEGDSLGEAVWAAVPRHCHVGGRVWNEIEWGVRRAYGVEDWQ